MIEIIGNENEIIENDFRMTKEIAGKLLKGEKGDLVVSPEHNVYSYIFNLSLNSLVEKTLISGCFLNAGSLDQIGVLSFNANAKKAISLSWGDNDLAFDSNSLNKFFGTISINSDKYLNISLSSSVFNLEYFNISNLILFNSSIAFSGANNFNPKVGELRIINLTGLSLKNETKILVSIIKSIDNYQPSFLYFFQTASFTLSPNFKQSSSVNSEFSSILSSFLSKNSLLTFSVKNCLVASDTLNSGNWSICFFKSSGIAKVIFGILLHPEFNSVYSVKDVQVYKPFDLAVEEGIIMRNKIKAEGE